MSRHVLLLAGWGQTPMACQPLAAAFSRVGACVTVQPIQAPEAGWQDALTAWLSAASGQPRCVVGWSLGGQLLLAWGQAHPEWLECIDTQFVLLASNPCFLQRPDWSGMAASDFEAFRERVRRTGHHALRRFDRLQTMAGSEADVDRLWLDQVRDLAEVDALWPGDTLLETLDWLQRDERGALPAWQTVARSGRLTSILGGRDRLVPAALGPLLAPWMAVRTLSAMAHFPDRTSSETLVQWMTGDA